MRPVIFTGNAVALVTPFRDGAVDEKALDGLIEHVLSGGVDAIVACGTTGEPSTLDDDEHIGVIAHIVRRVNGRVPVIAGTGGNNTAHVAAMARRAADAGAAAQLCVTPYYNKSTPDGLVAHYHFIADHTALPVIVYNVPSRTGLHLTAETLGRIARHERIVGVKEASGDPALAADMMHACPDDFTFYSGEDANIVVLRALGAKGVISVVSNIAPRAVSDMMFMPFDRAAKIQISYMPLIRLLFCEVNPVPVKAALAKMGLCRNELRLPLVPMSADSAEKLYDEMRRLGILCQS